jgi:hypothetical protein
MNDQQTTWKDVLLALAIAMVLAWCVTVWSAQPW